MYFLIARRVGHDGGHGNGLADRAATIAGRGQAMAMAMPLARPPPQAQLGHDGSATAAVTVGPRPRLRFGHVSGRAMATAWFSHGTVAAATGRETGSVTGEPRFGHSHEFDDGLASARQGSVTARSRLAPPRPRP